MGSEKQISGCAAKMLAIQVVPHFCAPRPTKSICNFEFTPKSQFWPQRNKESVYKLSDYEALFSESGNAKAIGEASPRYMYSDVAAQEIFDRIPKAKIIAILRHPAERAFSDYLWNKTAGRENCKTFEQALEKNSTEWQKTGRGEAMFPMAFIISSWKSILTFFRKTKSRGRLAAFTDFGLRLYRKGWVSKIMVRGYAMKSLRNCIKQ